MEILGQLNVDFKSTGIGADKWSSKTPETYYLCFCVTISSHLLNRSVYLLHLLKEQSQCFRTRLSFLSLVSIVLCLILFSACQVINLSVHIFCVLYNVIHCCWTAHLTIFLFPYAFNSVITCSYCSSKFLL